MIVEKGQQQQRPPAVAIGQQQQYHQGLRHGPGAHHLQLGSNQTSGVSLVEENLANNDDDDDDDKNDEENIVIDMADEDEDDEDEENEEFKSYAQQDYVNNNHLSQHDSSELEELAVAADNDQHPLQQFQTGDLVWFDPNQLGYSIPGKVLEFYPDLPLLSVEGHPQPPIQDKSENHLKLLREVEERLELEQYDLGERQQLASVRPRVALSTLGGMPDLCQLEEMSLESLVWNLKLRYKQELVYTQCGHKILICLNPNKQLSQLYNLDQVNYYDTCPSYQLLSLKSHCCPQILSKHTTKSGTRKHQCGSSFIRWLLLNGDHHRQQPDEKEPHIFNLANEALKKLLIEGQEQCFVLLGESGSGKTEACKLLVQYLATVNKAPTNLMTEQILESIQVLESFGNAKTQHNDNSSRFGKLLQLRYNLANGYMADAKTLDLNLLDRSRIVSQVEQERNYHIFYELLAGLSGHEKEKYGLQGAEKYFYLNQGRCVELSNKDDGEDFRSLLASMQVLGFNYEEQDTIFRLLASVLHLGNIYFHRKVLAVRSGKLAAKATDTSVAVEGVEIGSDTEVRWVSHLLQIQFDSVLRCLTVRTTESPPHNNQHFDRILTPLNIDQALDTRDAIARALYTCLFKWLVERINVMITGPSTQEDDVERSLKEVEQQPIYLCRTSESLCEFQPDRLTDSGAHKFSHQTSHKELNKKQLSTATMSILDAFGFENLNENNFEQLCINYTAELLNHHTLRYLFRLEQAEYTRERLRWKPLASLQQQQNSNSSVVALLSKKPLGVLNILDDECNFPKATDQSFVEKCHHNHTLNENYHRSRGGLMGPHEMGQQEFGIKHFGLNSRTVWYQADGFIEKNRDSLRMDIVDLLLGSKMSIVCDMLRRLRRSQGDSLNLNGSNSSTLRRTLARTHDGRFVSMKPRAGTLGARFQDALHNNPVLESITVPSSTSTPAESSHYPSSHLLASLRPNPWFLICLQPNRWCEPNLFDVVHLQEQVKGVNLLELVQIRKLGYPVRLRYGEFVRRYKCLVGQQFLNGLSSCQDLQSHRQRTHSHGNHQNGMKRAIREVCSSILEFTLENNAPMKQQYQCGLTKMFLNERLYKHLEQLRLTRHQVAISLLQRQWRRWQARRKYLNLQQAATCLQAHWRGYLARRDYYRQWALIVELQRWWRHQLAIKRRRALEARRRAQRQHQQHQLMELQAQQRLQADQFRFRVPLQSIQSGSGKRLALDIPDELAHLYRLQRHWSPLHHLAHIQELNLSRLFDSEHKRRHYCSANPMSVPFIVDSTSSFAEEIDENFLQELELDESLSLRQLILTYYTTEAPQFGYSRLPISRPFSHLDLQRRRRRQLKIIQRQIQAAGDHENEPNNHGQENQARRQVLGRFKEVELKALAIYKLLLRYIDSSESLSSSVESQKDDFPFLLLKLAPEELERHSQKVIKFKLLADYVIHLCLAEPLLRDELYLQLISQSWLNPRPKSVENVWQLILICLGSFRPQRIRLIKFLLRHAHDHCPLKYRQLVMRRLIKHLSTGKESGDIRKYPPSLLEFWSIHNQQQPTGKLALAASCYMDDRSLSGPQEEEADEDDNLELVNHSGRSLVLLECSTKAEELARAVLEARGLPKENLPGWSLEVQHEGAQADLSCRLRGDDHPLDHLSAVELLPEFAHLVENVSDSMTAQPTILNSLKGKRPPREQSSMCELNALPLQASASRSRRSGSFQQVNQHHNHYHQQSSELDLHSASTRLSQTSRLNRRYQAAPGYGRLGLNQPPTNYQCDHQVLQWQWPAEQQAQRLHRRSMSMQELQLASSSALNGRYFYQAQAPHNSNHYASSYVPNHNERRSATNQQLGSLQQLASPMSNSNPRRRSQTPNSMLPSQHTTTAGSNHRISNSSAYGSESRHSSSLFSGSLTRPAQQQQQQQQQQHRARRSSSSSSRQPPPHPTQVLSDYEHLSAQQQLMPNQMTSSSRPLNPQVERHRQRARRQKHHKTTESSNVVSNDGHYVTSSAMSDTSEAPSLASHVRSVRVPQHNADLDQYLDDLFNPMLDGSELDELSDARSLAAVSTSTHTGTGLNAADDRLMAFCQDAKQLGHMIRGTSGASAADEPLGETSGGGGDDGDTPEWPQPPPVAGALSPTFESLLESLGRPNSMTEETTKTNAKVKAKEEELTTSAKVKQEALSNLQGSVGKLKISSEMKAKLEQLTGSSSSSSSRQTQEQQQQPTGLVSQLAKSLLECQLSGGQRPLSSGQMSENSGSGKVLAAKQQLAAAAGLALDQLDSGSSSRRQSQQVVQQTSGSDEQTQRVARNLQDDELGPQSKAAMSQRQAFYLMSASSDPQLDSQSEKELQELSELRETNENTFEHIPAPTAVSSDNLASNSNSNPNSKSFTSAKRQQQSSVASLASPLASSAPLTRAMRMASHLNEAGRASELGKESERLYAGARLLASQRISSYSSPLKMASQHQTNVEQWVESSPDPTLEKRSRRAVNKSTVNKKQRVKETPMMMKRSNLDEPCLAYGNVEWQVKIRKEFFLPSEPYESPLLLQLILSQLVADVFNPRHWTRLNGRERAAIKALMKDNSIGYAPRLPPVGHLEEVKRQLVRMARSFGLYFTRAYPATNYALTSASYHITSSSSSSSTSSSSSPSPSEASESDGSIGGSEDEVDWEEAKSKSRASRLARRLAKAKQLGQRWLDMVAVHHSGLRLVAVEQREESLEDSHGLEHRRLSTGEPTAAAAAPRAHRVLETLKFRDMSRAELVGPRELLVAMAPGKRSWLLSSEQAPQLSQLLGCFLDDYNKQPQNPVEEQPSSKLQERRKEAPTGNPQQQTQFWAQSDALLAPHDGHHDGGIQQRQAPAGVAHLPTAPGADDALAHARRVLPDNLAPNPHLDRATITPPPPGGAGDRHQGNRGAEARTGGAGGEAPGRKPASGKLEESGDKKQVASSEKKHKNLWHNSLSRMSNKLSIFSGGSAQSSKSRRRAQEEAREVDQQQQQQQQQQVQLDAWIETKVDFDEDEDDAETDQANKDQAEAINRNGKGKGNNGTESNNNNLIESSSSKSAAMADVATSSDGSKEADGKYSMLQFALYNFREAIDKYSLNEHTNNDATAGAAAGDTSTLRGSLKLIESLRNSGAGLDTLTRAESKARKQAAAMAAAKASDGNTDWTWRELAEMVKFTSEAPQKSLLKLPNGQLQERAVDCFLAVMRYMGDQPLGVSNAQARQQAEVECVYLILMNCHNYPPLRDELYCQLMKQTTSNRSEQNPESCLRGWRLFSILAAYFDCSQTLRPYLLKYLETAAYDKRRAYCSVASLCLQNLRKTLRYGGRKNVPSIEEIAATSAGRNSKRQIYRLPGGTERVINTKSTTVVEDIIREICSNMLQVSQPEEMLEFSLYCIADGDLYTMPLSRDEYILDITTELIKNHQQYFLIFCRSIWYYPLRLDSKLYIEVIFNQIAPDYLEGLLLVLPCVASSKQARRRHHHHQTTTNTREPLRLRTKLVKEVARIAALLHRASGSDYMPHKEEIKYLLPRPIVSAMKRDRAAQQKMASNGQQQNSHQTSSASSAGSSSSSSRAQNREADENDVEVEVDVDVHQEASQLSDDTITVLNSAQTWVQLVQENWREMSAFDTLDAKAQFLDIVRHWPLFGSSFFAIKFIQRDLFQPMDFILALNKLGIQMLDMQSHETIHMYPFNEVISTRKVRAEDGALYLDLKCGNLMKRTIIRIQTDQAHEISRLIRQYIDIELLQNNSKPSGQQQPID